MIFTTTTIIIISSSAGSFTLGGLLGFFLGDRRRRNLERERHYDDLVYYLTQDALTTDNDFDITETRPVL